ncbi:MAG: hypothetical protein U0Q16_03305 [Bryobacteraceae bacterium]
MLPYIPKYDAILWPIRAVCYGDDVWRAFFKMETVEHYARISLVSGTAGGEDVLPREEVQKLLDSRSRYGVKAKSSGEAEVLAVTAKTLAPRRARATDLHRDTR